MLMANQIRTVRKSRDVTLEELSERSGLSVSFLSRMESAKRGLKLENALRVAKALGVEINDVTDEFNGDDIMEIERRYERAKADRAQLKSEADLGALDFGPVEPSGDVANLYIRGGMGLGSIEGVDGQEAGTLGGHTELYADHVNGFWSFPDAVKAGWRNMPQVYSIPVTGDSMEPTLISGSYVFVDMTHTIPSPEDIYACDYGDGLTIKRLQMIPRSDKIRVMSDNQRYASYELRREDVRVYGRVVAWFQWRG